MERAVERERLTADWYTLDIILLSDAQKIRDVIPLLTDVHRLFLEPSSKLAAKSPLSSAALLNRCLEYLSKLSFHIEVYRAWVDSIQAKKRLQGLPWPKFEASAWDRSIEKQTSAAHEQMKLLLPALLNATTQEGIAPDYRGQFIQVLADNLLERMMKGDAEPAAKLCCRLGEFVCGVRYSPTEVRARCRVQSGNGASHCFGSSARHNGSKWVRASISRIPSEFRNLETCRIGLEVILRQLSRKAETAGRCCYSRTYPISNSSSRPVADELVNASPRNASTAAPRTTNGNVLLVPSCSTSKPAGALRCT